METKHTPWRDSDERMCVGELVLSSDCHPIYDADGLIVGITFDRDDARRIVACINACKSIPTARLEAGAADILAFSMELKKQRDELLAAIPKWIDPNDKTQKKYLPHIGEPVLFCHEGATYYGAHNGGSFVTGQGITRKYFTTWECHWMYPPLAIASVKGGAPAAGDDAKDAARYRWLRNQSIEANFPRSGVFIGRIPENTCLTFEDADDAIDAAMQANTSDQSAKGEEGGAQGGCGYQGRHFGAAYEDACCIDGHLWDLDSCDEPGGPLYRGGDIPCPQCNAEAYAAHGRDDDDGENDAAMQASGQEGGAA